MTPSSRSLAAALIAVLSLTSISMADTIYLTNGNRIDGTVVTDARADGGKLVLEVAGGTMFFSANEIASAETPPAVEAPSGDNYVEVRLTDRTTVYHSGSYYGVVPSQSTDENLVLAVPDDGTITIPRAEAKVAKSGSYYGSGSYFGIVSPQSTEEHLVLTIPNAGTVTIPRSAIASIEVIEGSKPAEAAEPVEPPSEIATTHAIYMKNGRKLIGTILPTPEGQPVKVQIGHLGVVTIARGDIARIAEETGTITLPPPPPAVEPSVETTPGPAAPGLEALKEQIKSEVLRELLQELLDVSVGVQLDAGAPEPIVTTRSTIHGEEEIPVQQLLADLGRNRTQYRTRAEAHLKRLGPAVLPYVQSLVHHPFDLTRRAVQRIARDLSAPKSIPIAIEGLNDTDQFVREIAYGTVRKLLPGGDVKYRPNASRQVRRRAQLEYWSLWDEHQLDDARRRLLDRLTASAR